MPVGMAALPPNFHVLLCLYFRTKKGWNLSRFHPFSIRKLSYDFMNFPFDIADSAVNRGF